MQSDVDRITKSMEIAIPDNTGFDWQRELILFLQRVTIRMLEKILPFLAEESVEHLYYFVYEILGNFFGVDTGYIINRRKDSIIFSIIERLATLGRLEVTVTKRK